jgi:CheY-like chemotaxis protein
MNGPLCHQLWRDSAQVTVTRKTVCGFRASIDEGLRVENIATVSVVSAAQMSDNAETILVVDDEPTMGFFIRFILEREGYTVLEAGNCHEALRSDVCEARIDLLIADIALPDGNGWDLAIQFQTHQPDVKVLFISGYTGAELLRQYRVPPNDIHFLQKPFTPSALRERVRQVLESPVAFPQRYLVP